MVIENRVRLQQALFGYQEGHNLIAASVLLEPHVRQFLANVTDGSGSEKSDGFEVAHTGLPVPGTSYYALFCTWPAPEMPRPGCVWSHVVLIELADLSRIGDLSLLLSYFKRPGSVFDVKDYQASVELGELETKSSGIQKLDYERTNLLLESLYGHPTSSVVLLDQQNDRWTPIVFAVWSQQWPKLRRNFSFSTGSLGDRRSTGVNFDLQIAPQGSQRLWRRSEATTYLVEQSVGPQSFPDLKWLAVAAEDIFGSSESSLRKFFLKYGSEIELPRDSFSKLVVLFSEPVNDDDDDSGGRLAQVAEAFPASEEAVSLKRDQLTIYLKDVGPENLGPALDAVHFLLLADETASFSKVHLDISKYLPLFWKHKRAELFGLLGELGESPQAMAFIDEFTRVLNPEDVSRLWYEREAILPKIIERKPNLASEAVAWEMPETGQRLLWKAIKESAAGEELWAGVCASMLSVQCSFNAKETIALAGESLVTGLTKWLKEKSFRLPTNEWRRALEGPLRDLLSKDEVPVPIVALAIWVLWRSSNDINGHSFHIQNLARRRMEVPKVLEIPILFWLTALGLKTNGKDGLSLIANSFFDTYDIVAYSNYPGEAWEELAMALPQPKFELLWDRCKLMRRGLKRWLRKNQIHADALAKAAPSQDFRNLVLKLMNG